MRKNKKREELSEEDKDLLDDSDETDKVTDIDEEEEDEKPRRRQRKNKEEFDFKISHVHDTAMVKLLRSRGVGPLDIMHGQKSFNLEDVVQPIESQGLGKVKKINKNKQLNWYESSYRRVLNQSWLSAGIGGFPSDARAKQLALHLFMRAITEYQTRDPRKNTNRSLPLWHNVYGGFGDTLRDLKSDYPSFIIVSNLTPECTSLKFEKVRDILVRYNNMSIPVVVVCAGYDPFTFFSTKLYYPMQWGVSIGNTTITI